MADDLYLIKDKLLDLEQACRRLGLPVTIQRRIIMETLAERRDHPTADQIYEAVSERISGISRTTVYRVLDAFVLMGVAQRISNQEAKARFDANIERHHHVQCLQCGTVADIHDPALDNLSLAAENRSGFVIADYSVSFKGTCGKCLAQC